MSDTVILLIVINGLVGLLFGSAAIGIGYAEKDRQLARLGWCTLFGGLTAFIVCMIYAIRPRIGPAWHFAFGRDIPKAKVVSDD